MGDPEVHIAEWVELGLIDAETADRLRRARPLTPSADAGEVHAERRDEVAQAAAMFGPSVTIPEVFGYLGSGFLLAAWTAYGGRIGGEVQNQAFGMAALVAAVVLIGLGFVLRRGNERRRRAAGVAYMVGVAYVATGLLAVFATTGLDERIVAVLATGIALAVAAVVRWVHPSVLTQIALLAALTTFAGSMLARLELLVRPTSSFGFDPPHAIAFEDVALVVAGSAWWLATAVVIGLIALREERRAAEADRAHAGRRVGITRFWAGAVAVLGLLSTVTRRVLTPGDNFDRVIPAWAGELAIVLVCLVLLERAFRRDATSFVYAAAIGLIAALSDFNFTYLSNSTEIGLAIEGAILLGVGLGADRLRRRIRREEPPAAPVSS
ncbi:MAG TPA: hypothetical protein VH813_08480 [Candidatus Limnocylindrales bacterium]|jgi:hypothetical protein